MTEKVKQLLLTFGYECGNEAMLDFAVADSEKYVLGICNQSSVTEELEHAVVKYAAGVYLRHMKNSGQAPEFFSTEAAVKSITEGDISITYSGALSDEERLDRIITDLCGGIDGLLRNRRLEW